MIHPWKKIIEEIRNRNWTQKQFAILVWKKNSEVNELIKWKRNITIQRDYVLSQVLWTPEKYWINMQTDYDYEQMKQKLKEEKQNKQEFEVVEEIPSNNVQEVQDIETEKQSIEKSWEDKQTEPEKENIENTDKSEEHLSSWAEGEDFWAPLWKELADHGVLRGKTEDFLDSPVKSDSSPDKPQDDKEIEISEEEKQKRKEMKKIFINFKKKKKRFRHLVYPGEYVDPGVS